MDPEAQYADEFMANTVSMRRRSNSCSDDFSIQKTNDDAAQSKLSAVSLKYWNDPYLARFVGSSSDKIYRREPEISIGYWARVRTVHQLTAEFCASHPDAQIISLGAGYDTLYWRLKDEGVKFAKYIEVDFSTVTMRKISHIIKPGGSPDVVATFSEQWEEAHRTDLHAGDYHIVGADIRQWKEMKCVLVYLSETDSSDLLCNLRNTFANITVLNYEQLNTADKFTQIMQANLHERGLILPGLRACESAEKQEARFKAAGFKTVSVFDMLHIYKTKLDADERKRIEAIEHLDEMELVHQLLSHYGIVVASSA